MTRPLRRACQNVTRAGYTTEPTTLTTRPLDGFKGARYQKEAVVRARKQIAEELRKQN